MDDSAMAASSLLRVAVVQFAPKLGEVRANIAKARELCRGLVPKSVDLVCFPEMIFSGYNFPDAPSIAPYLEHPKTGLTATFCSELARHLQCFVAAGYPERLSLSSESTLQTTSTSTSPTLSSSHPGPLAVGANTAVLYAPDGALLHAYRKTNLFTTDIPWARAGSGFATVRLPLPFGPTTLAICNDLNVQAPAVWDSLENGPYELADHCLKERTRVLVLLNAWLLPSGETSTDGGKANGEKEGSDREGDEQAIRTSTAVATGGNVHESNGTEVSATPADRTRDDHDPQRSESLEASSDWDSDGSEPNLEVLNYWAMRLRPLWAKDERERCTPVGQEGESHPSKDGDQSREDTLVIACNRFGHERGKIFAGSSAMLLMRPGSGKPRLLHAMGEREEGVSVWSARIRLRTA